MMKPLPDGAVQVGAQVEWFATGSNWECDAQVTLMIKMDIKLSMVPHDVLMSVPRVCR